MDPANPTPSITPTVPPPFPSAAPVITPPSAPTTEDGGTPPPPPPPPVIDGGVTPVPGSESKKEDVEVAVSGGGKGPAKKKWGAGVLVGSVAAVMVLVVGLGFGIWQVRQNQNVKKSAAGNPGNITFSCSRCASDRRCQTPDIGENPSYSVGAAYGSCNQVDYCTDVSDTSTCRLADPGPNGEDPLCAESCSGGSAPTPHPVQCSSAPTLEMSIDGGAFSWRGGSQNVSVGQQICYKSNPSGNHFTSRQTRGGLKGAVNVNSTACFTVSATDPWTTGEIEAFQNACAGAPDGTCEQIYTSESCRNSTDLVVVAASPTPTPTPTTSFQCQQVKVYRGGAEITIADIKLGDVIVFRGFANATNTTVSKIAFVLTKGGVAQAPVDETASLVGGLYQADYEVTVSEATSYSVTATPISP